MTHPILNLALRLASEEYDFSFDPDEEEFPVIAIEHDGTIFCEATANNIFKNEWQIDITNYETEDIISFMTEEEAFEYLTELIINLAVEENY